LTRAAILAGGVLSALLATQPALALFSDDEARKAILDLRARVAQLDEQHKARQSELQAALERQAAAHAQLVEQLAALRRSLLDLNNQLEQTRTELARLRGADEQAQRELAELQKRQRDLGQAIDERVRRLEPVRVSVDGREFNATPDERKAYDDAVALMRGGEFDKAAQALLAFQRRYPGSGYADSVRFWLGNAHYARRDHKEAIATFRAFVAESPDHPRAPEAMLALANSQAETKDIKAARKTLEDLLKAYPRSEAAQAAKDRLAALK
jgi:tol-pal system protein YbgF